MAYENLKGTLKKSFKIGSNGVMLTSHALIDESYKFLKINKNPVIVFQNENEDGVVSDYDGLLNNDFIKSISYFNDTVSFNLTNGESIKIKKYHEVGNVSSVNEQLTNPDEVVVFNGTNNKEIKSSKLVIKNEINETGNGLVTVNAVTKYVENFVGEVSNPLESRLKGSLAER